MSFLDTWIKLGQLLTIATKLQVHSALDITVTQEDVREVHTPNCLFDYSFLGHRLYRIELQFINDTAKVYARRKNT